MKNTLHNMYAAFATEPKDGDITISYGQYRTYAECPNRWKLTYVDKIRPYTPSIHTCFGTSFHETLQHYLSIFFLDSVKSADNIDLHQYLLARMRENYKSDLNKLNGAHFSTSKEIHDFYEEGCAILDWFKKYRGNYFNSRSYELVGIEIPLYTPASKKHPNLIINGFLDLVIRDKSDNRLIVWDIKTSMRGWSEAKKSDKLTASQLVMYKMFLSEQYNIDVDSIDISYFIVKRQIYEDSMYPQKRVQTFIPASGKLTRKKLRADLDKFIDTVFLADGTYNKDIEYPAITGEKNVNCKYCSFTKDELLCPKSKRQIHETAIIKPIVEARTRKTKKSK